MTLTSNKVPPHEHNRDRVRRARSWLKRSETCARDRQEAANPQDETALYCEQFIFLWIAFNAAYGKEPVGSQATVKEPEPDKFKPFLNEVVKLDRCGKIYHALWGRCSSPVGDLLDNKWVFYGFWRFVRGLGNNEWRKKFEEENIKYYKWKHMSPDVSDIADVLGIVVDRLYQLRNQILHGGTTFAKTWGRPQMKQGCEIMATLVPAIIAIMESDIDRNPGSTIWGDVAYPRGIEPKD